MAILLSNTVWEGTSVDTPSTVGSDGQFFKRLDTGESFIHRNGHWEFINLGLSFIKATKSGIVVTDVTGHADILFTTPLIDNLYSVELSIVDQDWGGRRGAIAYESNQLSTGFHIHTIDIKQGNDYGGVTVAWLVTRNYNP